MNKDYYTVDQIADMLNIHPKTIQRYIREGRLRAVKIGKAWRVSGHDLSTFTESKSAAAESPEKVGAGSAGPATASAVVDIGVTGRDAAIRIMNAMTAALNAKPPEYGQSSMHVQFLEEELKVRVTLWGGVRFMAAMLEAVALLTENNSEE